ncbi:MULTISPECIES: hydroxymethylglutaryl-CoA reductase [Streptomyces]|uniref:hydroxymethylglutaryl-CoA reductase n=1 Tax=Streptomyces TaxID=1883 RepID=UPI000F77C168|nr:MULTISPECIES: hydroxymethylglutaryl-CoA reductase [Streptomyces]RST08983.1 hydroxymethylglutaryl-CoA reductase [Streptomyces sp. WAC07149]GLX19510.1 hydroxymethylglutaryl-CoA reductase (NADPH) [Streptomyces lavendulae subsp. lavendulae]GLX27005.1 hydroxymethylglutaryl-CoA reductase (NADPH) [Streptomyces lavendulae subsp. lavendulae]
MSPGSSPTPSTVPARTADGVPDGSSTPVPLRWVGPLRISGNAAEGETHVPLATYESPLWPSVGRGARVSLQVDAGITATLVDERMTRSVLVEARDAQGAHAAAQAVDARFEELRAITRTTSRFAELLAVRHEIVGPLLYLRLEFTTGDASGHNMATLAADALLTHLLTHVPGITYGSISANYCTDKKATAVNGILGRGKNVTAEILVPRAVVERRLHTTAARIARLNTTKNLIGTLLAGGIRSANAHYANMLLAFYLATGQDAANIVEGSQGVTYAEDRDADLYFSCTLPNLIVGTVGNGKGLPAVEEALTRLGCRQDRPAGANARRLAALAAATVLCGELSLLAAQTNPGELMSAHTRLERTPGPRHGQ